MNAFGRVSLLVAVMLPAGAVAANATTISLNQCNVIGVCGEVSVITTLVGDSIDVDVVDVAGGAAFGIYGDSGANRAFGFNVVDPDAGVTISDLTAGFVYAGSGVNHLGGGYGDYEFVIDGPHSASGATLTLHFRVSRTGGFTSDMDVFEANADGYAFNAHVRNNDSGLAGFASTGPSFTTTQDSNAVPEPASLALLGGGLVMLALRLRRRQPVRTGRSL